MFSMHGVSFLMRGAPDFMHSVHFHARGAQTQLNSKLITDEESSVSSVLTLGQTQGVYLVFGNIFQKALQVQCCHMVCI